MINVKRVEAQLTKAFQTRGINAIALVINSPGGSPAQSSLIYRRLRELKREHPRVKLLAFVEDYAASGGYPSAPGWSEIRWSNDVSSRGFIARDLNRLKLCKDVNLVNGA